MAGDENEKDGAVHARLEQEAAARAIWAVDKQAEQRRGPVEVAENEAHLVGGEHNRGDATNQLYGQEMGAALGGADSALEAYEQHMIEGSHIDARYSNPTMSHDAFRASHAPAPAQGAGASTVASPAQASGTSTPASKSKEASLTDATLTAESIDGLISSLGSALLGKAGKGEGKGKLASEAGAEGSNILSANHTSLFGARNPQFMAQKSAARGVPPKGWDPGKDKK